MLFYEGFEINSEYDFISEDDLQVLYACYWMVDNESTIRETAKICGYSTTTFWRRIHRECKEICPKLYELVKAQININLRRIGRK